MRKTLIAISIVLFGLLFLTACGTTAVDNEETETAQIETRIFNIGLEHHTMPQTAEEYAHMLALQWGVYSQIASYVWLDNLIVDLPMILGNHDDREQFWFIYPDGTIRDMTSEEALAHGFPETVWYTNFSFFEDMTGLYVAINFDWLMEDDVMLQGDGGRGPLYLFYFLIHEAFHALQQPTWVHVDEIPNLSKRMGYFDLEARAMRDLLRIQLLDALANPNDTDYILNALSTFVFYRENHYDDYLLTWYWDSQEGAPYWFDLVASLHVVYGEQIQTDEDLHAAISYIAKYHRATTAWGGDARFHGAVSESYIIGALALSIIDRYQDRQMWQSRFAVEETIHPMQMLLEHFYEYELPEPTMPTEEHLNAVYESIYSRIQNLMIPMEDFVYLLQRELPEQVLSSEDFEQPFFGFFTVSDAEGILTQVVGEPVSLDFVDGMELPFPVDGLEDAVIMTWGNAFAAMQRLPVR